MLYSLMNGEIGVCVYTPDGKLTQLGLKITSNYIILLLGQSRYSLSVNIYILPNTAYNILWRNGNLHVYVTKTC